MFAENNSRVWGVVREWLRDYFPAQGKVSSAMASA
jgi:hypothetical protein